MRGGHLRSQAARLARPQTLLDTASGHAPALCIGCLPGRVPIYKAACAAALYVWHRSGMVLVRELSLFDAGPPAPISQHRFDALKLV